MTFDQAKSFEMPWGQYKGIELDKIAFSDSGLLYLDWMRGERFKKGTSSDIDEALAAYLDDRGIAGELKRLGR